MEFSPSFSGAFWHSGVTNGYKTLSIWNNDNNLAASDKSDLKPFLKSGGTISKGTTIVSNISSSEKNIEEGAYEVNGLWRWRAYRGSDIIDPSNVTYSTQELYPGELVTITVTPRTPTYGGTIYYQYQYSINGGRTWTNAGSKTTETSKAVTIPAGTERFRVRVLASDGWGFTSTTYVYGPDLEVSQMKAYATVQGVNRSLSKAYAVVDGTFRSISKGYVTVDGVWKKLF